MHQENKAQVRALYMENQSLFRHRAIITKVGSGTLNKKAYKWLELNETIFHPKGGGQLSDEGTINGIKVVYVHKESPDRNCIDRFSILHCFDETAEFSFKEGDEVELVIDASKRELYSRMHTAGHILAETVGEVFSQLEPHHGNHDPKDGYVKFKMLTEFSFTKEELIDRVQPKLNANLAKQLDVSVTRLPSGMRAIQIGSYVMSCGGTHVRNLNEIGSVMILDVSINKKEKIVTIKYQLDESREV